MSYLKQCKTKADQRVSFISKSLPIVYFPFLNPDIQQERTILYSNQRRQYPY